VFSKSPRPLSKGEQEFSNTPGVEQQQYRVLTATVPGVSSNGTGYQQQQYRMSAATVPGVSSNGTGYQ
jgi:hypothetical protein